MIEATEPEHLVPSSAAEDDREDPWKDPVGLLDRIEQELWEVLARCAEAMDDGGDDAAVYALPVCGSMEVVGLFLRPLRAALREAGLDIPQSGEWERLADEWHAARESQEPSPGDPEPEPERGPYGRWLMEQYGRIPRTEPLAAPAPADAVAPEVADTTELRETPLYRWYDEEDLVLYIGISDKLGSRTHGHAMGSSWMDFAARSTVERYPSRAAALAAEEAAIKAEQPLFNHVHNRTPGTRQRLVDYLVKRGRTDLLAPAVSRG